MTERKKRILARAKKAPKVKLHIFAPEEKTMKFGPEIVHEVKRDGE